MTKTIINCCIISVIQCDKKRSAYIFFWQDKFIKHTYDKKNTWEAVEVHFVQISVINPLVKISNQHEISFLILLFFFLYFDDFYKLNTCNAD